MNFISNFENPICEKLSQNNVKAKHFKRVNFWNTLISIKISFDKFIEHQFLTSSSFKW